MLSAERSDVIDDDTLPEGLAGGYKSRVIRAFGLIKFVIFKRFEVQRGRKVEGVIGDRAMFRVGRGSHITAFKVRDLSQATNLAVKDGAFRRGKVFAEPEDGAMDEHIFI